MGNSVGLKAFYLFVTPKAAPIPPTIIIIIIDKIIPTRRYHEYFLYHGIRNSMTVVSKIEIRSFSD